MCKLLLMTGITEGRVAEEFMKRMAIPMSTFNKDGIGYTGVNPDGSLFSQKWLNNEHFFDLTKVMTPEIREQLEPFRDRLPRGALNQNYMELGTPDFENVRTITMHTRMATCEKGIRNTHPFIDEDTSLVHNGVIRNADTLGVNKISTCDSEAALQTYLQEGVASDTKKALKWLDRLSGGWAFGILSRNEQGNRVLDVVRGGSMLYYMEIEGLGSVFTTNDDDAKGVAKEMGLKFVKDPYLMSFDSMYRFDAVTGEMLEEVEIKKKWVNPHYNTDYSGGYNGAKGGRTTTTSKSTQKTQSSQGTGALSAKDRHYNLQALLSGMAGTGDPDCVPDILLDRATWDNPEWDHRKVHKYCNDVNEPIIDRLDIFDMVFGTHYTDVYERLSQDLKDYVEETDMMQGAKSVRQLLKTLENEMVKSLKKA